MSNVTTTAKIAVDSSDLDKANNSAKSLSETISSKIPAGAKKMGAGFAAASAAAYAIYAALETVDDAVRSAAESADDFTEAMDNASRTRLLKVAADVGVVDDELARLQARQAAAMADVSDWFNEMVVRAARIKTSLVESIFGTPREVSEIQAELDEVNASIEAGFKNRIQLGGALDKQRRLTEELNKAQAAEAEFNVSQTKHQMRLEEDRARQLRRYNRDNIQAIREEGEARINAIEQEIKQDPTPERIARMRYEQETIRQVTEARVKDAERINAAEQKRIEATEAAEKKAYEAQKKRDDERYNREKERAQQQVEDLLARQEGEEAVINLSYQRQLESYKKMLEEKKINQDDFDKVQIALEEEKTEKLKALNDGLVDGIKTGYEDASSAASQFLGLIDKDMQRLFDSGLELIKLLSSLGGGSGGNSFFSALSSLGSAVGGVGGGSGVSRTANTFNSGVSVGTLAVTVNGGSTSANVAGDARRGVNDALQAMMKQQMANETKFGGILNPSSGVTKV